MTDPAHISVEIPIRTVSECNAHEHWRKRADRVKAQRGTVGVVLCARVGPRVGKAETGPLVVYLTRTAPCELDSDNYISSFKGTRDAVAEWLGVDDRDPRVRWEYLPQKKGAPRAYAVTVAIAREPDRVVPPHKPRKPHGDRKRTAKKTGGVGLLKVPSVASLLRSANGGGKKRRRR